MQKHTSFIATTLLSCTVAFPALAQDETPTADTIVATVNGTEITLGHMIALRARLPEQYQDLPNDVLYTGLLDQLVQQSLLSDISEGLSKENTLVLENETRSLQAAQVFQQVAADAVTDEALQSAYDETYTNLEPEPEFNASHILVETEEAAAELLTELEGGADFANLAAQKSTGPSGPNGGLLGWFGKGMMVAPFEAAVETLEVGAISAPVQTQFGWHVIKLNDKRSKAAPPLDQVRPQLADTLQRDAIEGYLSKLEDGAEISRVAPADIDVNIISDTSLLQE
ncbi:MAG: peptidylprolyl isomerase [Rhodobacteraceae bacterium]|nr:peptidylprolyl isomerase [Paracoccaceae bacterium]